MFSFVVRYKLIIVLLLLGCSTEIFANKYQSLEDNWRFQYGDEAQWSTNLFDDSHWPVVSVPGILNQIHGRSRNGWYRIHFDTQLSKISQSILIESIRHSDETWLNGVKIGAQGSFEERWTFNNTNPQSMIRLYGIPEGLLIERDNVLAIKVAVGFGEAWGALYPGGAGIYGDVILGSSNTLQKSQQNQLIITSSLDVLFITLALVDVLIIIFLLKNALGNFPEFKWLIVSSLLMLMGTMSHDFFYIHRLSFVDSNLFLILTLLFTPVGVASYFWSQNRDIKAEYLQGAALCCLLCSIIILTPSVPAYFKVASWYLYCIISFLCFFYALYIAIKRVYQGDVGSIAQLIALAAYLYSIRTQWMLHENFGHRNIQIGSLLYRYGILFAYFQQIAHLRLDYKKLSERIVNITEKTRHSLARELHDGLGQHLASMKMHIQLQNNKRVSSHTDYVEIELKNALLNLRRLINGLHPIEIDECCISKAIEKKCLSLSHQYGIEILFQSGTYKLDKEIEQHIFRIFQECVANAIKHGKPTQIIVIMSLKNQQLTLTIEDNGSGFDTEVEQVQKANGGFGYISLNERVALLNGAIKIVPGIHCGVQLTITLPITSKH